jgi:hypothetical protein
MAESTAAKPRGHILALCLALVTHTSSSALLAVDTHAERIDDSACTQLHELGDVRGHLLFGFSVSAEGRVGNVRLAYDRVEHAESRESLIKALTACINAWKFRPATKDGRRADSYQLTPFHFFKPAPVDDIEVPIPGGRTIGLSRIHEMSEEKLLLAEKLLAGRTYSKLEGEGWVLRTNVRRKFARDLEKALDLASEAFDTIFPSTPTIPEGVPVEIVLFRDIYDYTLVVAFDNLLPGRAAGDAAYSPDDHTIYAALGAKPPAIFTDLLVHEATHHLIDMRLYGGNRRAPTWVSEGIASFIASIKRSHRKGIDLARVERGRESGGGFIWKREAESFLDMLKATMKKGALPPLQELMEGEFDESFYKGSWDLFKGISWALVHYLINADGGKYREAFERWILSKEGSTGDAQSLATALGKPLPEIEAALPAHIKSMK